MSNRDSDQPEDQIAHAILSEDVLSDEMHSMTIRDHVPESLTQENWADLLKSPGTHWDEWLRTTKVHLIEDLQAHGYPHPLTAIIVCDGNWSPLPEIWHGMSLREKTALLKGKVLTNGLHHSLNTSEPFSHGWFAAELLSAILSFERAKKADRCALAFQIGNTLAMWQSRRHLKTIRRGTKTKRAAAAGGMARSRSLRATSNAVLREMKEIIDKGISASRAADLVFQKGLGTSKGANLQLWKRRRK